MAVIFSPCFGAVVKVAGCNTEPFFSLNMEGLNDGIALTAPLTGFALEMNGNYQFLHTVNDFIYVYSFGNRMGELTMSGIGFVRTCTDRAFTSTPDLNTYAARLGRVFDFYRAQKLSSNGRLSVSIGGDKNATFYAFLTGMRIEMQDAATMVGQWSMRFSVVPKKNSK